MIFWHHGEGFYCSEFDSFAGHKPEFLRPAKRRQGLGGSIAGMARSRPLCTERIRDK
jgi:hypothetical protein